MEMGDSYIFTWSFWTSSWKCCCSANIRIGNRIRNRSCKNDYSLYIDRNWWKSSLCDSQSSLIRSRSINFSFWTCWLLNCLHIHKFFRYGKKKMFLKMVFNYNNFNFSNNELKSRSGRRLKSRYLGTSRWFNNRNIHRISNNGNIWHTSRKKR